MKYMLRKKTNMSVTSAVNRIMFKIIHAQEIASTL